MDNKSTTSLINGLKESPNNGPTTPSTDSKRLFGGRKKFRGGGTNSNVVPLNNIPISSSVSPQTAKMMQQVSQTSVDNSVQSQTDSFKGGRRKRRKSKRRKSKRRRTRRKSI